MKRSQMNPEQLQRNYAFWISGNIYVFLFLVAFMALLNLVDPIAPKWLSPIVFVASVGYAALRYQLNLRKAKRMDRQEILDALSLSVEINQEYDDVS